jgi:hypothetical protein
MEFLIYFLGKWELVFNLFVSELFHFISHYYCQKHFNLKQFLFFQFHLRELLIHFLEFIIISCLQHLFETSRAGVIYKLLTDSFLQNIHKYKESFL